MITSVAWIPRGAARSRPVRFELSPEEYERIKSLAKEEQRAVEEEEKGEIEHTYIAEEHLNDVDVDTSDLPSELNMDQYDDDEEEEEEEFDDSLDLIPEGDGAFALEGDSEDEDAEDDEIRATDTLLAVAMTEDEYSHLEIQTFTEDGTLYVHHDITLPEFPLCLAWLDCPPFQTEGGGQSTVGNFMAVGTFNPAIEIWNLDVLDPLEPTATLGGEVALKKKKGSKKKLPTYKPGSHEGAVMSMSWNRSYRQALASGSADTSVKIWDVTTQICSHTFNHHRDKVQSVLWHPEEAWMLASGSFDKTISIMDCRNGSLLQPVQLPADIESLVWDPFRTNHLYCSMEDGQVMCIDIRKLSSSTGKASRGNDAILLQFQAHEKTVSSLDFSSSVPGLCATSSIDQTIKIWDMHSPATTPQRIAPKNVFYKSMNVGNLFSVNFSRDEPFLLATGGESGIVAVWDCDEQQLIKDYFQERGVIKPLSPYAQLREEGQSSNDLKVEDIVEEEGMELVSPPSQPAVTTTTTAGQDDSKKKKKNKVKKSGK